MLKRWSPFPANVYGTRNFVLKLLKASIERREKLLSNENYINKAPKNIVELDKRKLEEEKIKLEELTK